MAAAIFTALAAGAAGAAEPIKIGFGMGLTGGLAASGKAALLAMKMQAPEQKSLAEAAGSSGGRRSKNPAAEGLCRQSTGAGG
jgi:hypothetical protein